MLLVGEGAGRCGREAPVGLIDAAEQQRSSFHQLVGLKFVFIRAQMRPLPASLPSHPSMPDESQGTGQQHTHARALSKPHT